MTDSVRITETGPRATGQLLLLPGGPVLPDYMTLQVTNRFRGPHGYESETGTIRLSPEQQDELHAGLTRLIEARRALDLSDLPLPALRARAYVRGEPAS